MTLGIPVLQIGEKEKGRLEAALDRFQNQDEELKHYHNKLSEALNKTTQVLSSC